MLAYLPCELKARDFESRLLIAAHLCKRGVDVVVGQLWGIMANVELKIAPPGISLFATANSIQASFMKMCRDTGHDVLVSDEEALALADEKLLLANIASDSIDIGPFLFQNKYQENVVKRAFPHCRGEIVGSARVDLLRKSRKLYQNEVELIGSRGKYVLVNTGFALVNSIWGDLQKAVEMAANVGTFDPYDEESSQSFARRIQDEIAVRDKIVTLIRWMVGEGHRVVVRPHPAENVEAWREISGIEVVAGSNAIPWMLGASLVIHANSTTGLEAALLSVPCLNVSDDKAFVMATMNFVEPDPRKAALAIRDLRRSGTGPIARFKVPRAAYPAEGARNIADALIRSGSSAKDRQIETWGKFEGTQTQREKFTVSTDEYASRASAIWTLVGAKKLDIVELDRSVILFRA